MKQAGVITSYLFSWLLGMLVRFRDRLSVRVRVRFWVRVRVWVRVSVRVRVKR